MNTQSIDFSKIPESDCVINFVLKRYHKGLGTNIFVTGVPGSGKSSTCLRYGELLYEKLFPGERISIKNVADSLLGILEFLNSVKRPGEVLVVEEASVLFSSRRSMSSDNVEISKIFDTVRKKQVVLICNAPIWRTIDSNIQAHSHLLVETLRINKKEGVVISKILKLQLNVSMGKVYKHKLTRDGKDIFFTYTRKPDSELWKDYEQKKDEFIKNLYNKMLKRSLELENGTMSRDQLLEKNPIVNQANLMLKDQEKIIWDLHKQGLSTREISKRTGPHYATIATIINRIKQREKDIEDFKKLQQQQSDARD